jgi:hypothetical protein
MRVLVGGGPTYRWAMSRNAISTTTPVTPASLMR